MPRLFGHSHREVDTCKKCDLFHGLRLKLNNRLYVRCGSTIRRVFDFEFYECSICHLKSEDKSDIEECEKNHLIERNWQIIKDTCFSNRKIDYSRFLFAIYRLYRYHDFSPKQITKTINETVDALFETSEIQAKIGRVFSYLCRNDTSCVFKKFLSPRKVRKLHPHVVIPEEKRGDK